MKRRDFVKVSALGSAAVLAKSCSTSSDKKQIPILEPSKKIKVVSTWISGIDANREAIKFFLLTEVLSQPLKKDLM